MGSETLNVILRSLYEILDEQREIIGKLIDYTEKQTQAMCDNNLDEIKEAIKEQIYWAERLGDVGERHLDTRERLEKSLGLPPGTDMDTILKSIPDHTTGAVFANSDRETKARLSETANLLAKMMQDLKGNIEANRLFADQAIGLYSRVLNTIQQKQGESYTKEGKMSAESQSLLNMKG